MNDDQKAAAFKRNLLEKAKRFAWPSTITILVGNSAVGSHMVGCGVLVRMNRKHFVMTAAHVVRPVLQNKMVIGLAEMQQPEQKRPINVGTPWLVSPEVAPTGKNGTYDVAVNILADDVVQRLESVRFLEAGSNGGPEETRVERKPIYSACGFPGNWTENLGEEAGIWGTKHTITLDLYEGDVGALVDYDPLAHFLLDGSGRLEQPFTDRYGQEARFPIGMKGMSGCGVWHMCNLADEPPQWFATRPQLAGIQTGVYQAHGAVKILRWRVLSQILTDAPGFFDAHR